MTMKDHPRYSRSLIRTLVCVEFEALVCILRTKKLTKLMHGTGDLCAKQEN